MPYLQVRGTNHYYEWLTADGTTPTGQPVMVFLHGWAGSGRYWQSTAQALRDRFDCLIYDLRGFGRSRLPQDLAPESAISYDLETYADDLALFLDALDLKQVYLNGHSVGASITLLFLNRYPERVKRAILTCHGLLEYDEKAFAAFHKFSKYVVAFRPRWLSKLPFAPQIFMQRFLHRSLPFSDCKAFMDDFLMADFDAALGTVYTSVSKQATDITPVEYGKLQVPTLLISGQYDQIIQAEMGRQAAALNPDKVTYVVIDGTGHFPMLEDPVTYRQRVNEFLGTGAVLQAS